MEMKEKNDGKDKNVLVDSVKGTVEEIKKDRNLLFAAIAGACSVLLVVLVVVLVMIGTKYLSPSYRVINQYMKGCQEMDVDSHMDLYHEDVIEVYESEGDYDFEEMVESMFEDWEEDEYEIKSYKIVGSAKFTEDQLEEYAEEFEEDYDIDEDDITDGMYYYISLNYESDNDEYNEMFAIPLLKIEGKWYIGEYDY